MRLHPAVRLAMLYALVAGAWIVLSDRFLAVLTSDPVVLTHLQTLKGWVFVGGTGLLLYLLVRRELAKIEARDALVCATEASLKLQAAALEAAANAIAIADRTGRIIWVNSAFVRLTGYAPAEAIGQLVYPEDPAAQNAEVDRTLRETAMSGGSWQGERVARRKDGSLYTEEQTLIPVKDTTGTITHLIAIKQDISARKQAEAALASERNLLRTLIDNLPDYIFIKDTQSRFIMVNRAQANLLGLRSPDDAVGKTDQDLLSGGVVAKYRADEEGVVQTGNPLLHQEERGPDQAAGEPAWHLTTKVPLRDAHGSIVGLVGISRNITALKRAEQALLGRTRQLEAIRAVGAEITRELDLHALLDLITQRAAELVGAQSATLYLWDEQAQILVSHSHLGPSLANGPYRRRLGEGVAGTIAAQRQGMIVNEYRTSSLATPESLRRTALTAVIGEPLLYRDRLAGVIALDNEGSDRRFTDEDGEVLALLATQAAIAVENARLFGELNRSYANLRHAQEELIRAEKLRALGRLAAGIAHDLNNTLAAILGQAELMHLQTSDPDLLESLGILEVAATDGVQVVRRLQAFARQQPAGALAPCDLATAVSGALDITRPRWRDEAQRHGRLIELKLALDGLPPVLGRATEIREALTNLILNAVDAMPGGGSLTFAGRLVPTTAQKEGEPSGERTKSGGGESAPASRAGIPKRFVELTVTDTGIGMSDNVRRQAFEPFFTTKAGQGTGLGLAMVYGIMERHGGTIEVVSTPAVGTTFILRFQAAPKSAPTVTSRPQVRQSPRRVLVIDDDPRVRRTVVSLLRAAGHHVAEAEGGRQGLSRFAEEAVDLVLTDLGMPEVTGWDVAAAVKARVPQCPVVVLTGWGDQRLDEPAARDLVDRVLHKPVRLQELLQVITELTATTEERGTDRLPT